MIKFGLGFIFGAVFVYLFIVIFCFIKEERERYVSEMDEEDF